MNTGFFVGQPVRSPFFGDGVVVSLRTEEHIIYPVVVNFAPQGEQENLRMFAADGAYHFGGVDPKMDILPVCGEDDHATLPIEWPGPVSAFLFSDKYETVRRRVLGYGGAFVVGLFTGGALG